MLRLKETEIFTPCIKLPKTNFTQILLSQKFNTALSEPEDAYIVNALSDYFGVPVVSYHEDDTNVWVELSTDVNTPYTMEQMRTLRDENNYITGLITICVYDMIDMDIETFLDTLSTKLTGTTILHDINYEFIGNDNNDNLIFRVTGDLDLIINDED